MKRRNWTSEEDQALAKIVSQNGNRDWTHNSLHLQFLCGQHRSGKQCRERWVNYLCPDIEKAEWGSQENEAVFNLHRVYGNKWKKISEHFPGRTDNCIKNHFYSTLRRSLRRFNKYLGCKNSTQHIRTIKPTFLTQILNFMYAQETQNSDPLVASIRDLPSVIYSFSTMKPNKSKISPLVKAEYEKKVSAVINIIQEFSKRVFENKESQKSVLKLEGQRIKQEEKMVKCENIIHESQNLSEKTCESLKYLGREIKPIITIIPKPFNSEE